MTALSRSATTPIELPGPRRASRWLPWRRPPTILLVEDDEEMRRLLELVLRRDGYEVVACPDGDTAIDWLGDGVFDGYYEQLPALVVSDVRLPYIDGLELLETLHSPTTGVPIVLITAFPDAGLYERAFALGARSVLAKPFDLDELRAVVWTALHERRATGAR